MWLRYRRKDCDRIRREVEAKEGVAVIQTACESTVGIAHPAPPTKDILFVRDWICDSFSGSIHPRCASLEAPFASSSLPPSNPPHPLSYSSIPPSPLLVVPFFLRFRAMTRPVRSVLLTRTRIDWEDEPWRGNNKARDHVYHTLLDTVSHHGPPWNRVSWSWFASLKDVRFGHTRYIFKLSLRRFAVSFGRVLAGWLFYLRKAFPIRNVSRHCSANSFYTRRVYCSSDALGIERMK